jgi:hypothetical protein
MLYLQAGQFAVVVNQSYRHCLWNRCPQLTKYTSSPTYIPSKQIGHSPSYYNRFVCSNLLT